MNDLTDVFGVEADIWLPENAPVETAVLIGIAVGGTPLGSLDLWNDSDGPRMYIDLSNFETNESISYSRNAALGTKYRVGIIEDNGKTKLFLNGEKVAEVTATHSENVDVLFRGESDATVAEPYSAYLDNVRVLREPLGEEVVSVVSDPYGKPVVNQVGDEYRWNDLIGRSNLMVR